MDKKRVGQKVKLARVFYEQKTGKKMTQQKLAEMCGTTRGTIGDIELVGVKRSLNGSFFISSFIKSTCKLYFTYFLYKM
jgi:transcriptional regulator with XRE-family HTH domain